jgi:predicted  nucleic acid-binding Zn-ribbon protein
VVIDLEPLLALQERDLALDRLHHRREALPERDALRRAEAEVAALQADISGVRATRDEIEHEERKLDDQAQSFGSRAVEAEKRLYSGEIASPRELQALQTDVEQLKRHQREVEDRQLATMERREPLDARIAELERSLGDADASAQTIRDTLTAAEAEIDLAIATESTARGALATGLAPDLVAEYERCRAKANGVGAARLVGNTCQGCHLSIPATEVERIKKSGTDEIAHCDNCGCILVP